MLPCFAHSSDSNSNCPSKVYKKKPKVSAPVHVTGISRLTDELACLDLNNIDSELTGYTYFRNVAFDPRIAVNPLNPKNMVIATQQDTLINGNYNDSASLAIAVFYTLDGGETWNPSDLVMSRCQGSTLFNANDNFISAYFPAAQFDQSGNCYVLSSSYDLFAANQLPEIDTDEGNIISKSTDGGRSWTQVTATYRDNGQCHLLDFPNLACDRYRKNTLYVISTDATCQVSDTCEDPNYTGGQNIVFQKSEDAGLSWSDPIIIDSFIPTDLENCTPWPILPHFEVLADKSHSYITAAIVQQSPADTVGPAPNDQIYIWKSLQGTTWKRYTVDANVAHILAVDPDSSDPVLPVTSFTTLDFDINPCNGYIYIVYTSPMFNPTGKSGCVIRKSKDGGVTWSTPKPVNPNSLSSQAFLPVVAVAKDGTVGVMFTDFRNHTPGDEKLSTDVWVTMFDAELNHVQHEVRLTPKSFDTRKSVRGYNGINPSTCALDYYLSTHVEIESNGNDFVCTFPVTNDACPPVALPDRFCDSFPVTTDACSRQNIVFVNVKRH